MKKVLFFISAGLLLIGVGIILIGSILDMVGAEKYFEPFYAFFASNWYGWVIMGTCIVIGLAGCIAFAKYVRVDSSNTNDAVYDNDDK